MATFYYGAPGRAHLLGGGAEVRAAAGLLRDWIAAQDAGHAPEKLVYSLEHAYSIAELGFSALKNVDAAVAQVLAAGCWSGTDGL
jgi:hypothetical protein